MPDKIPISAAKALAKKHNYDQVIILARRIGPDGIEWVTTYGKTPTHCAAAAKIGEALRDDVTPTIEALRARIAELELEVIKAGYACADDLGAWVNTLEDDTIKKTNVYEWAMAWKPRK